MLQGFQHVCTDNIYQEFLCFNADEGATKLAMCYFSLSTRGKTLGKIKELQPHPYLKKKHFFAGTWPGYSFFDEYIISSCKMDIFGARSPMYDTIWLLLILVNSTFLFGCKLWRKK